jgi:hypothetical protein
MPDYRQQSAGSLLASAACPSCPSPCGVGVTIPSGNQGYYNLDFDAGSTAGDTGAIVVYFNPMGVPDGIRVLYDGIYYNTVTNNTDGRIQSTSGVADAFTILGDPASTCVPATPNTNVYNSYDGFSGGSWNTASPATKSITINTGDDVRGGQNKFNTLIIPKTSASPKIVSIQALGPCAGTAWDVEVTCPAALPNVSASGPGSTDACQPTQNTPLYFAKNYNDANTTPIVGNFVFTDENGATYLNNVATIKYYIVGTIALGVQNGVVVSSGACTNSGGSSSLILTRCTTGDSFTLDNSYNNVVGDVLEFQIGTPGSGATYCGTVTQVNVSSTNDATLVNGIDRGDCSDSVHCPQ